MKASLNWIRFINDKYKSSADPAPDGVNKLVEKIGAQLGAVEEVINLGERYKGIVVVKVVSCERHPNADKLTVCLVDDGGAVKNIKRDKAGLVEIVCGAPNVKAGQTVAWVPPGAVVPSSFDKDQFVIEKREIRGITSNGMLASPKELALGDSHDGLLIIEENVKPGTPFAEVYGLDDHIIDIENKMFTHRPDLFGQLGVARELAGIQGHSFKSPDWYREDASIPTDGRSNGLKLEVKNELPKLVPRFSAVAIKDIKVGPSPMWLQVRLTAVGIRPINNIVDVTNFYMMETAQPLHAYDYDKVRNLGKSRDYATLEIGYSAGNHFVALDGKVHNPNPSDIMIKTHKKDIGFGGVIGGQSTSVDEFTTNIILECATFDMNTIRKTSMTHGLFTDAATRFTKNQSPRQNMAVLAYAVGDINRVAGGQVSDKLVDDKHFAVRNDSVKLTTEFINSRLGEKLSSAEIKQILENVEFKVVLNAEKLSVTVPFWRTDIEIPEDIVEEVGRLYGYDKLPQELPRRAIEPAAKNSLLEFKDKLRQALAGFGANEVLTYSFVHNDLLKKAGQDSRAAYKLTNALSPNLQYYRFSLLPSLLDRVHANIKHSYDKFALFEIGKGHDQDHETKDGLPQEFELLSMVYTASPKTNPAGAAYYQVKQYLSELAARLGIGLKFTKVEKLPNAPIAQPFALGRTAMVSTDSGQYLGIIGEFKPSVTQNLKLPEHTAGFEIDIEALAKAAPAVKTYQPLPRFPQTDQDLCLRTAADLSYAELTGFIAQSIDKLSAKHGYAHTIAPLDIYQRPSDKTHKQTAWRLTLWHPERTLVTEEVNKLLDQVAEQAKTKLKAERI